MTVQSLQTHTYPAPKKYVLVLSCVDYRLLDDLVRFLNEDNLTNRYYHVALAGTSLGLTDAWTQHFIPRVATVAEPTVPSEEEQRRQLCETFSPWKDTFKEHIKASLILTNGEISDIYIIQHQDCGAYRVYLRQDFKKPSDEEKEMQMHCLHSSQLMSELAIGFRDESDASYNPLDSATGKPLRKYSPIIHTFFMNLRGQVRHLQSTQYDGTAHETCDAPCDNGSKAKVIDSDVKGGNKETSKKGSTKKDKKSNRK